MSITYFEGNDAIDDYVKDEDYEDNPKLCFTVSFEVSESNDYVYSIRYNQTFSISETSGELGEIINIFNRDLYKPTSEFITQLKTEFHWQFFASGFIRIHN